MPPPPTPPAERLPLKTILVYCAPSAGFGFMFFFTSMYLMKYATDVLAIAPAAMGVIFLVSRVWDGISDPLAGYLSDRTRTRLGRRRPWMLIGAPPACLLFVLMWAPPRGLESEQLVLWMGAVIVLFYSAMTVFGMPHDSLGAELTDDYHDRNRLFGIRRAFFGLGALPSFGAMGLLASAEDPRATVLWLAAGAGLLALGLMFFTGVRIRERPEYQGRGAERPFRAVGDVLRNPHARILLAVFLIQQTAVGCITVLAPYYCQYILGDQAAVTWVLAGFFVASLVAIPAWIALGRVFEKKSLIMVGMGGVGLALASMWFLGDGDYVTAVVISSLAGACGGGLDVLFPSIQADVIDYDELRTSERKEGVYFATWHVAAKSATGVAGMLVGFGLAASGFVPNAEQSESARFAIRGLMSAFPFFCYTLGTLLFARFALTETVHAGVRAELDARPALARETQ